MEPRLSIITLGVSDMARSYKFYKEGLGFPTDAKIEDDIYFFKTSGTVFALYPYAKLIEDVYPNAKAGEHPSSPSPEKLGITLAHNTREKDQVDAILKQAEQAGGTIKKQAQDVFWGGYSGYFTDPDGYFWEIAYADSWTFNDDGSLIL